MQFNSIGRNALVKFLKLIADAGLYTDSRLYFLLGFNLRLCWSILIQFFLKLRNHNYAFHTGIKFKTDKEPFKVISLMLFGYFDLREILKLLVD